MSMARMEFGSCRPSLFMTIFICFSWFLAEGRQYRETFANERECPKNAFKVLRFTGVTRFPNTPKRGRMGGDSACLELSRVRGDWGNVKGREAYVSVFVMIILSVHVSDIGIMDSALSADTDRIRFDPYKHKELFQ